MPSADGSPTVTGRRISLRLAAVVIIWCMLPLLVWACNVPVFRYALERWSADAYQLEVFYTGQLDPAIKQQLDGLAKQPLNLNVSLVDLATAAPADPRPSGLTIDREHLPWMVLRYPDRGDGPQTAWSGRLDGDALARLTDSPARQEIVRRLLSGESGVWVLLESGVEEKDRAARELIEREIATAEKELHIPASDELDYSASDFIPPTSEGNSPEGFAGNIELKVDFSLLTLSRNDAREEALLGMLLHSEPDLDKYTGEPMAFLIFGQGRVLWAVVGKGITGTNISEACAFLTAACSCQVKSMNPGTDLLTSVDWNEAVDGQIATHQITSADLTTVAPRVDDQEAVLEAAQAQPAASVTASNPSGQKPALPATGGNRGLFMGAGLVLGGILAVAVVATVVVMIRKQE